MAVLFIAEARETQRAEPDLQGPVAGDQDVQSQIEFLGADQERFVDVSTDYIWLFLTLLLIVLVICPFLNLF